MNYQNRLFVSIVIKTVKIFYRAKINMSTVNKIWINILRVDIISKPINKKVKVFILDIVKLLKQKDLLKLLTNYLKLFTIF